MGVPAGAPAKRRGGRGTPYLSSPDGLLAAFDATPDADDDEVRDLVLLRERFGLGAREVYQVLPAWEAELLAAAARHDQDPERGDGVLGGGPVPDPWASAPDLPI